MKRLILFAVQFASIFSFSQICLALPTKEAKIGGFRSTEDSLTLHIQTHNSEHVLNLKKPESSVLSKNFKLHIVRRDENGRTVFVDQTPSLQELYEAERRIFIDPESNAALQVHHDRTNGVFRINGHFSGHSISHEENGQHFLAALPNPQSGHTDYIINSRRRLSKTKSARNIDDEQDQEPISITPELAIVFDYANYKTFEGNHTAMATYAALFINGVNNRYANIPDPKISFKITGLVAIGTIEDQPFIRASEIPGGDAHDLSHMLTEYTTWVNNSTDFPIHDMAPLFTAVHLQSEDKNGNYVDGVAGLATLGGACFEDSTSIIFDSGANYAGTNNLAHELAHSLGSSHDADVGAENCPQSDGYIMSYEGDGQKANFYFSECSIALIKNFVTADDGSCLKTLEAPETWETPTGNPGDYVSLTTQCQKALNNPTAFADPTIAPDDICTNLVCTGSDESGVASYWQNRMPADGSYCGESGSCFNGECVVELDMDTQCQTATGKENALADTTETSDSLCKNLICKYTDAADKVNVVDTKKPAIGYSPCGRRGRCIDNSCAEPTQLNMTEQCIVGLFNPNAFVEPYKTPDELCTELECRYTENDIIYSTTIGGPPTDYTPCGVDGYCLNGKCTGDNESVPSLDDFVIY